MAHRLHAEHQRRPGHRQQGSAGVAPDGPEAAADDCAADRPCHAENLYNADQKLANALGFKNGDEFFTDPKKMPPKPPQQDPHVVKAQADQQSHMAELQFKAQQGDKDREHTAQIEQIKAQMQMQVDRNRQDAEAQQHALKVQYDAQLAEMQEQNRHAQEAARLDLDRWKAQLASDTAIYIAQINNQAKTDAAQLATDRATPTDTGTTDGDA
jgi:hypothetical protein